MESDELISRCESMYDRVIRDVEEARTSSWHAHFVQAFNAFHEFIQHGERPSDIRRWMEDCQNHLLTMAPHAPKLTRELLSIDASDADIDIEQFEAPEQMYSALYERIEAWLQPWMKASVDLPFAAQAYMVADDIRDFYRDIYPGWRCWQVGSPAHMFEASCNWNISPWHWTGHLFQAILTLNALKHVELPATASEATPPAPPRA